jgi:hypothetical protein
MYRVKNINIPESVLVNWDERFLPTFDLFYFKDVSTATKLLSNDIFITTRDEFSVDRQLSTLDVLTTFSPWHVSREAKFIAIVPNEFFLTLDKSKRQQIIEEQWRLGRGQLWEKDKIQAILGKLDPETRNAAELILIQSTYKVSEKEIVAFHRDLWDQLPKIVRYLLMLSIADEYVNEESVWENLSSEQKTNLKEKYKHLIPKINRFANMNGPNCFAATLSCISKNQKRNDWIISQWVQPEGLMIGLALQGYDLISEATSFPEDVKADDVLIWKNDNHDPIHASFALGEGLVFNKNGQTMFNPWQVLTLSDVQNSWGQNVSIYRKS